MKRGKKLLALLLTATMLVFEAVPVCAAVDESSQTETAVEVDAQETTLQTDDISTKEKADVDADDIASEEADADIESENDNNDAESHPEEAETASNEDEVEIAEILPGVDDASFCSNPDIIADKELLSEHVSELNGLVPGIHYDKDEIVVSADSEEEALLYADAFAGTLLDCEYGFALIRLNTNPDIPEVSVDDVVQASANNEIALPAAWPSYYGEYLDDDTSECNVEEPNIIDSDAGYTEPESEFETYIYNDPYLKDSNVNYQWQHYMMQTNKAWQAGYTGQGVTVAVIDSGVYNGHEDLSLTGFYKWNGSDMVSATPSDDDGHGSHCTGIVGAKAGNGKGGSGIAPGANLYSFRVSTLNEEGKDVINMYAIAKSINKATYNYGASVITISIGSYGYQYELESAVNNAYNNGTAVFVASGNASSSIIEYPAAYKNAIAVAAVNQNNVATSFSNISSKVRYTGPGYDIYSTHNKGTDSYTMMSGTSQATPCVAGAAAVLLSSGLVTGTGKTKVDNLLKLMDKSCVASGVGKGTPNLAKGLGLSNSTTAPLAPVAKINGTVIKSSTTFAESEITVNVTAETGAKIYYALNSGSIKYKDGVVSDNAVYLGKSSGSITISGAAGNTLKLIAVSSDNGLSSKEAGYNIKLEPKVNSITLSAPNEVYSVAKGGSVQLTASVSPAYAKNKAVTWDIPKATDGVTISAAGKVSVKATSTASTVTVRATAKDGSGKSNTAVISITAPKPIKSIKASATAVTIYDGDKAYPDVLTTYSDGTTSYDAGLYTWTSSNSAIAKCGMSGTKLVITGVALGKATISGIDKTGLGKKVTINVTVNQKISNITISGYSKVAQGKALKPVANIEPEKVTDKKLKWEIISIPAGTTLKDCGVTISNSTGAISTKATAVTGTYKIRATANDKGQKTADFSFTVIGASSMIKNLNLSNKDMRLYRVTNSGGAATSGKFTVSFDTGSSDNLAVTSSAPGIATATISGSTVTVRVTGKGTGTAKISVMSTDGSNLKKDCTVTVVNPVTKLYLTPPKGRSQVLAYNKTLKLTPVFVTESGAIDAKAKNVEWSSSNTNYVTVDKSGNAKAVNPWGKDGAVTVTARTTDGSNLTATYEIFPNGYVTKMDCSRLTYDATYDIYYFVFNNSGYGTIYNSYQVTVSGPTNGLMGNMVKNRFYIYNATIKGNYTINVKRTDGSNVGTSARLKVY